MIEELKNQANRELLEFERDDIQEVVAIEGVDFGVEFLWQQGSYFINKCDKYNTNACKELIKASKEPVKFKLFRGFKPNVTLQDITDSIKTNNLISTTTDIMVSRYFATKDDEVGIIIEIDVDKAYKMKYRDMGEKEFIVDVSDIKSFKVVDELPEGPLYFAKTDQNFKDLSTFKIDKISDLSNLLDKHYMNDDTPDSPEEDDIMHLLTRLNRFINNPKFDNGTGTMELTLKIGINTMILTRNEVNTLKDIVDYVDRHYGVQIPGLKEYLDSYEGVQKAEW